MSNITFAIAIATYQRPNGKTPFYLSRALDCVLKQTYSNWKVYLYGDKYEDNEEFMKLSSIIPSEKLHIYNMPVANERDNVTNPQFRWRVAGCNTMNVMRQQILDDGFEWICHLDDDDYWTHDRLQVLYDTISKLPDACFIYNYSTHGGRWWPPVQVNVCQYNNLMPQPGMAIHASQVYNARLLKQFKFKTWPDQVEVAGDWQFLEFLTKFLKENPSEKTLFIPQLLTYHDREGEFRG